MTDEQTTHRLNTEGADLLTLAGVNDANLIELQRQTGIRVALRGDTLTLVGSADAVERATSVAQRMIDAAKQGTVLDADDVLRMSMDGAREPTGSDNRIVLPGIRKIIQPKTPGQAEYLGLIAENDIVVGIGPAGTGKTYLAVAMSVLALKDKQVERIVLVRPAVEAGENLGFLPGGFEEKDDPYLRPLYEALRDLLGHEKLKRYMETGVIEIAPLAYMRGRTLSNSFVILDEAQNTTLKQMKMFLTRLGPNSKAVITGDVTQIDLQKKEHSGLVQIQAILESVKGIQFCYFTEKDVVRHRLVKEILKAFNEHEAALEAEEVAEAGEIATLKARRNEAL